MLCPRDVKFLISGLYDVRKVIKYTPILHLQRWIFGGQVVPDPLSECMLCPGDVRSVKCQECDQRNPYPPSPELDPWRTVGS